MIGRIVSRGLDAPAKFAPRAMHGTEEASNDGRARVRIIHGLTLVIKNSHTYCKDLLVIETKYYAHAPRGIDW